MNSAAGAGLYLFKVIVTVKWNDVLKNVFFVYNNCYLSEFDQFNSSR